MNRFSSAIRMTALVVVAMLATSSWAIRVKDVASIDGMSNQQLVGYGLVVGLAGTGDGSRTQFTVQSVANMLQKMGIEVSAEQLRLRNVAAVMVTADQSAFLKPGQRFDVNLSSLGDARSLEGGTLLMTPMQAEDGEVYAMAQGPISVGGMQVGDSKGRNRISRNHALSGNIPGGAQVKREVATASLKSGVLRWVLREPDFSSAQAMADAINKVAPGSAKAEDAATVTVTVPQADRANPLAFISKAEKADFQTETVARVVINERTGTLVSGADVRIGEVAVAHGNIVINTDVQESVSQPNALTQGRTGSVVQEQMKMQEEKPEVKVIPAISSAGDLAQALNTLGVAPRDIIAIFQAIKRAGALQAELVLM